MPVSYLCDSVGHIAQLPQLIRGFGMKYFVGWRGTWNGADRTAAGSIWEAPDGSRVLMADLTSGYYHPFTEDYDDFAARIDAKYESLARYEKSGAVLLMQGADHRPPPRPGAGLRQGMVAELRGARRLSRHL